MLFEYPEGWEILWENEPDGGWEIMVGVAGAPSRSGRPAVTARVLQHAVLNFAPAHVTVFASDGPGMPLALVRTPQEYNEECKKELRQILRGVQFISEKTGTLAGMPSATLFYSYPSKTGTIREKQINLFGLAVTYRLLCETPEEQSAYVEKYFDRLAANFKPSAEPKSINLNSENRTDKDRDLIRTAETPPTAEIDEATTLSKPGILQESNPRDKKGSLTLTCKRCGSTVLPKPQFIQELEKHGIQVDQANIDRFNVTAAGGFGGYNASVATVRATYEKVQKRRAFRCRSCRAIYCMECLLYYAPSHQNGGKACPSCGGALMEM